MTAKPSDAELLPCPFCGKEFLDRWPCDFLDASGTNVVRCAWCHGAAPMAKWNTRAPARELDMSTKPENLDTLAEHVHGIDNSDGWLPIDSAPRDGSMFLFDAPDIECGVSIGYFDKGRLHLGLDGKLVQPHATPPKHWQPLPAAPANGGG